MVPEETERRRRKDKALLKRRQKSGTRKSARPRQHRCFVFKRRGTSTTHRQQKEEAHAFCPCASSDLFPSPPFFWCFTFYSLRKLSADFFLSFFCWGWGEGRASFRCRYLFHRVQPDSTNPHIFRQRHTNVEHARGATPRTNMYAYCHAERERERYAFGWRKGKRKREGEKIGDTKKRL